jgi:integrase/recombinase XerD
MMIIQFGREWALSDLGRAHASLTAYRSALAIILRSAAFTELSLKRPGLKTRLPTSASTTRHAFPAASATLQLRLSAIRLWYDFLTNLDLCQVNPLPRSGTLSSALGLVPRVVKLASIPDAQWQSFLFTAAASPLSDRLMLALSDYGALRRSEGCVK